MSKGYIETTKPIANDIVYGEFKIYYNHNLPSQILGGSVSGGLKVSLERAILKMHFDGAYGAVKGLRRYEKFIPKISIAKLGLKYFVNDIISSCEDDDDNTWESNDWAGVGGTYAAETTLFAEGEQSSKMTADTSQHGIHEVFASSKDLTTFENGDASPTTDYIGFSIYITTQDLTDLGSADLRISFHMDAEGTETNYYYYDVAASALTADVWNDFKVAKSAFTETGTGDWTTVLGVSMKLDAAPSAEVVAYIDGISLIKNSLLSTVVPVSGGEFNYVDEGDYREFTANLGIEKKDYLENIVVLGQKHDGKAFYHKLNKVYISGNLSLALEEKKNVVTNAEYFGHYRSGNSVPYLIREYK